MNVQLWPPQVLRRSCRRTPRIAGSCQSRNIRILPAKLSYDSMQEAGLLTVPKSGRQLQKSRDQSAAKIPHTAAAREKARKRLHWQIWHCMASTKNWNRWQQLFGEFKERRLAYCEVTYTLLLWGYVLSHRHRSESAFLVLEAMKNSGFVHGALIRANEGMLNSFFELQELHHRPVCANSWQNIFRLLLHCAQRYQKRRWKTAKQDLLALPPNTMLALDPADVKNVLLQEVQDSQSPLLGTSSCGEDGSALLPAPAVGSGSRADELQETTTQPNGSLSYSCPTTRHYEQHITIPSYGDVTAVADRELKNYCGAYERSDYLRALEVEEAMDTELTELLTEDHTVVNDEKWNGEAGAPDSTMIQMDMPQQKSNSGLLFSSSVNPKSQKWSSRRGGGVRCGG
ncbi:unnamed protein product [Amoebophrya sp. A120]|nr:unnamed protein product [Amoebophrya sp. A120]|eukprot:GSA120T00002742001.1